MHTRVAQQLGEIAMIEQELGAVVAESADRVEDPELKARLSQAAGLHHQHAQQLLDLDNVRHEQPDELPFEIGVMKQKAQSAEGDDDLLTALGQLEEEEEVRFGEALAADLGPEVAEILRSMQGDISDHVRVFLDEASVLSMSGHR